MHLCNVVGRFVVEDQNLTADGCFLLDALDDIARLQIYPDRISTVGNFMVKTLNFGESGLQAVLIRQNRQRNCNWVGNQLSLPTEPHIAIVPRPW